MGKATTVNRRILARTLIVAGEMKPLQFIVPNGHDRYSVSNFQFETESTVFVDTPLALLDARKADESFFDILNSIATFDGVISFLRESGILISPDSGPVVLVQILPGGCMRFAV